MKNNTLSVPKESDLPVFTYFIDLVMLLTFIIYLEVEDGKLAYSYTTPFMGYDPFIILINLLSTSIPIVLFLFTILYLKQKVQNMVFPLSIMPVSYFLYEIYSIVEGDAGWIGRQWFKVATSIVIFLLFLFTVNLKKIKSKYPLSLSCLVLIAAAVIMTVCKIGPFVDIIPSTFTYGTFVNGVERIYLSSILQFISYLLIVFILAWSLRPEGLAKQKEQKFKVITNMDKIQAINSNTANRKKMRD